jgi:hypothetical protein
MNRLSTSLSTIDLEQCQPTTKGFLGNAGLICDLRGAVNGNRWHISDLADILISNIGNNNNVSSNNSNKLNHIAKSIKIVDNSVEIFGISTLDDDDDDDEQDKEHHKGSNINLISIY